MHRDTSDATLISILYLHILNKTSYLKKKQLWVLAVWLLLWYFVDWAINRLKPNWFIHGENNNWLQPIATHVIAKSLLDPYQSWNIWLKNPLVDQQN